MREWLAAACLTGLSVSCSVRVSMEGRPCGEDGECIDGYVCDDASNICVAERNLGDGPGAGVGDPGAGDPGAGDSVAGDAGDSGAGDPGAGDPVAGDPAAGDPGAGDPGAGDAAGDPGWCSTSAQCGAEFCCGNVCVASAAPCDDWLDTDWSYRRRVTIAAANVTTAGGTPHADFPLLLAIVDTTITDASRPDGTDVVVTDADGLTVRAHEVERFENTGEIVLWVKVPFLGVTDTVLWVYYGNPSPVTATPPGAVWTAGFEAVWHMNQEPSGTSVIRDSLAQHDAGASSMTSSDLVEGLVGLGIDFAGNNDFVESVNAIGITGSNAFTMQAWVRPDETSGWGLGVVGWGVAADDQGNYLYYSGDEAMFREGFYANGSSTAGIYPPNANYMVHRVYDGATAYLYVNGSEVRSRNPGTVNVADSTVKIGLDPFGQNRYFGGVIDEVRVSTVARTPEWITTEYANQSDPGGFAVWEAAAETIP